MILIWWLVLPGLLWGQGGRRDEIVRRGVLRVGTTGDYAPFSYRANDASPFIGFEIEMARELATALGVRLEWVKTSWPALMADLARDQFDIAMSGVSVTPERQQVAAFSLPYWRDGKTPITRRENEARFQTVAQIDRPGVRAIVNPGGTNERFARANFRRATLVVWADNVTIFDRIVAGEADVMITDAVEARLQERLRPELVALHPEKPFTTAEKAYLLPRDAEWKAAVDAWLQPLLARNDIARRMEKWLAHPWPRTSPDAIPLDALLGKMAERLALMPDVARHKWNHRAPIEDISRENQVVRGLRQQAEVMGIPGAWAEEFFRSQIDAAKIIQRDLFTRWEAAGEGTLADAPDLETVTRPKLDALTPLLLRELALAWPALSEPAQAARVTSEIRKTFAPRVAWAAAADRAAQPLRSAGDLLGDR